MNKSVTSSIARWYVTYDTSDNESDTINLVSGNGPKNYIVKVISTSEVAATYSIVLTSVPTGLQVKLDNGAYQTPVNNRIEFNNAGSFIANDSNTEHTHTLTINAPIETNISGSNSIGINITFNQVN